MINYRVSYSFGEGFVNSSQITPMVISKIEQNITEYDTKYGSLHLYLYSYMHIHTYNVDSMGLNEMSFIQSRNKTF